MTSTFIKLGILFFSLVCSFMVMAAEEGERELRDLTQTHRTQVRQIQDEMMALAREGIGQAELERRLTDLSVRLIREDEDICWRFSALLLEEKTAREKEAAVAKEEIRAREEAREREVMASHRNMSELVRRTRGAILVRRPLDGRKRAEVSLTPADEEAIRALSYAQPHVREAMERLEVFIGTCEGCTWDKLNDFIGIGIQKEREKIRSGQISPSSKRDASSSDSDT